MDNLHPARILGLTPDPSNSSHEGSAPGRKEASLLARRQRNTTMETKLWIELLLITVAILANGLFAGSEIALASSRISRLAEMREKGVRGAAAAFALKESPCRWSDQNVLVARKITL